MKRIISLICAAAILTTLVGCEKRGSLLESTTNSSSDVISDSGGDNGDLALMKISELRADIGSQIDAVKNAEYKNLHAIDDLAVVLPETDVLYDLKFTRPELSFNDCLEKFDRVFDREFGHIYSPEDKEKLYLAVAVEDDFYADDYATHTYAERADKFKSDELEWTWLFVRTDKAYLEMYPVGGDGIFRMYRDGVINRAEPDAEHEDVIFTDAERYFNIVKSSLDVDSDEKYPLIDKEMSVKEAAEEVKRLVLENEYSYGGSLDPDVYEVRIHDIGEGKYGFTFMMTPSYKGVLFDVHDTFGEGDGWSGSTQSKLDHAYDFSSAKAFIMESGKLETFCYGECAYNAEELAAHDSVIPLETAVKIASDEFGAGMDLTLARAELLYSARYYENVNGQTEEEPTWKNNDQRSFPVWKLKCSNSIDAYKYIIYVNAITGELEYQMANGWVL